MPESGELHAAGLPQHCHTLQCPGQPRDVLGQGYGRAALNQSAAQGRSHPKPLPSSPAPSGPSPAGAVLGLEQRAGAVLVQLVQDCCQPLSQRPAQGRPQRSPAGEEVVLLTPARPCWSGFLLCSFGDGSMC